jgi:hypothetical protein
MKNGLQKATAVRDLEIRIDELEKMLNDKGEK